MTSSTSGLIGNFGQTNYGAAKAGLNALTRSFAFAYGPKVRVNCIVAGPFLTDISKAWDMPAFEARAKENLAAAVLLLPPVAPAAVPPVRRGPAPVAPKRRPRLAGVK